MVSVYACITSIKLLMPNYSFCYTRVKSFIEIKKPSSQTIDINTVKCLYQEVGAHLKYFGKISYFISTPCPPPKFYVTFASAMQILEHT